MRRYLIIFPEYFEATPSSPPPIRKNLSLSLNLYLFQKMKLPWM
eukprot:UN01465